jgi:hypothetical protein
MLEGNEAPTGVSADSFTLRYTKWSPRRAPIPSDLDEASL